MIALIAVAAILLAGCTAAEPAETVPEETVSVTGMTEPETTEPETTVPETEPPETRPAVFSGEITFSWEYIRQDDYMPYALFTPSTAAAGEPLPMIVWLHGMGERDANEQWFMSNGLPPVLQDWSLEGFSAYVICPQLRGDWNEGNWTNPRCAQNLRKLLDYAIVEYNVDPEHIIIGGFSLGGRGAMYMALELPEYFSRLVVFSSLSLGDEGDIRQIQIPTMGCSEYAISWNAFMKIEFLEVFGEDSIRYYDTSHPELIGVAFNDDQDGNGRSDVVEWMLLDLSGEK